MKQIRSLLYCSNFKYRHHVLFQNSFAAFNTQYGQLRLCAFARGLLAPCLKVFPALIAIWIALPAHAQKASKASPLAAYSKVWEQPKYKACNTAANANYMSDTEQQMIYIINLARAYPALFCKTIMPHAKKISVFADTSKDSYKAMVKRLKTMKPLPLLQPDSLCYEHAHCHAVTTGAKGLTTTDQQPECSEKHYKNNGQSGHYGSSGPLAVVISLMESYGIFFEDYTMIAVARAYHAEYQKVTVFELAKESADKPEWETPKYNTGKSPLALFSTQWNNEKYKACNTAANASYLTDEEKQIIYVLNLARTDPQFFCKTVVANARKVSRFIDTSSAVYYKSLVKDMMEMKPLPPLTPDSACHASALCHATTSGEKGYVGHTRQTDDCKTHYRGECCQYGVKDPLGIVLSLLVDQNVESLGHRHICLGSYTKMAPSIAKHAAYGVVAVLDFYY